MDVAEALVPVTAEAEGSPFELTRSSIARSWSSWSMRKGVRARSGRGTWSSSWLWAWLSRRRHTARVSGALRCVTAAFATSIVADDRDLLARQHPSASPFERTVLFYVHERHSTGPRILQLFLITCFSPTAAACHSAGPPE